MGAKRRKRPAGHRSNGRGTYVIDVRVRGVGRIKRASGTTDVEVARLYRGMVAMLAAAGRIDVLRSLQSGAASFAEVWDAVRPQSDRPADLNRLPSPETVRRLWHADAQGREVGALARFIGGHECSASHRANMRRDARNLRAVAKQGATVGDLPSVLKRYRVRCVAGAAARSFNMARTTAQAFLRETVGRFHPLYAAVSEVKPLGERRRPGRPMSAEEAREFCDRVGRVLGAQYGEAMWALCTTGMRPAEYWGAWEVLADRVRVRNAKQKGAAAETWRELPRVASLAVPRVAASTFRQQLWKKGIHDRTAYDGRRTFAHAMQESGIPRARRRMYLGHGVRDVTDLYERHEVARFLETDGAKLRAYFGLTDAPPTPPAPGALRVTTPATTYRAFPLTDSTTSPDLHSGRDGACIASRRADRDGGLADDVGRVGAVAGVVDPRAGGHGVNVPRLVPRHGTAYGPRSARAILLAPDSGGEIGGAQPARLGGTPS